MTVPTEILSGSGVAADLVGGKAASLDRLMGIGVPVPPTGVITTDGYRAFVSGSGIQAFLEELRSASLPEPAEYGEVTKRIDEAFLTAKMPPELRDQILRLAAEMRTDGELAVRSSATAEDLAAASFAGQYRSFLEVRTEEELLRSVRLVWASLWLPAPRSYRRFRRIPEDDLAMAVVVMRLVDAKLAGVVFTVDP
ncbi:MAG: PEP/pyruvate-binding domain-containing protein, partial [Acidimicrobiia bacterium]